MSYWSEVMRAIKTADIIMFILDARMPEISRNRDLEKKLISSGKKVLMVYNKVDLISSHSLKSLMKEHKNSFFVSVTDKIAISKLRIALFSLAKKHNVKLEIGVVGYPNTGKSAIINVLLRASKTKVSSKAGTTTGVQWASSSKLKLIDSPGVIPFEDNEVKLGVLGAKNPERLKDPESVALEIIKIFLDDNNSNLYELYNIKIEKDRDEYEILLQIGDSRKLLKKGGVVDLQRTSLMIVKDWQKGKLKLSI